MQQPFSLDNFRSELKNAITIIEKLAPFCKTYSEMVELCNLAVTNEAQAKLVLDLITKKPNG